MIDIPFRSLLILFASWVIWRAYRLCVVKCLIPNLPGPSPESWMFGNLNQFFDIKNGMEFHRSLVQKYGGAVKYSGMAGDEQLYFSDPRALHNIVIKDQDIFEETTMFIELNRLVFGEGLLSSLGNQHKKQRKMLSPVFSINHMRNLVPIFYGITHQLCDVLTEHLQNGTKKIDVLDWLSRTALEYIGQAGLGHSFDVFEEEKDNNYTKSIRDLTPTAFRLQLHLLFVPLLVKLGPPSLRRFLLDITPFDALQKFKNMVDVMDDTSKGILRDKRLAIAEGDDAVLKQTGQGKDIISTLLRENGNASEEDRLPEKEILGQMSTLIFAAHDTTSSAMSRVLHMLCLHPDAQKRVRDEVTEARATYGDIPYDELVALPYLDAVCRETLRLHPPVPYMLRTARRNVVVPLLRPVTGTDGKPIHEIPVASGQGVVIGICNANCDPAIWGPDAAEWKPERWLAPLPESVTEAHLPGIYSNTMTFLGGGRACIGFKFSQLEMKVVLSMLLEKFCFSSPEEEIVWHLGNIQKPNVKGKEKEPPSLPLKVSVV